MAAKFSKTPAVVAALKKTGADLKARDIKGRTPLHTAAVFSKTPEVVTALIQVGADLNARDKRGRTPLEFAEKFSRNARRRCGLEEGYSSGKNEDSRRAEEEQPASAGHARFVREVEHACLFQARG